LRVVLVLAALLGGTALAAQAILRVRTLFSMAWSVCLSVVCLSHSQGQINHCANCANCVIAHHWEPQTDFSFTFAPYKASALPLKS